MGLRASWDSGLYGAGHHGTQDPIGHRTLWDRTLWGKTRWNSGLYGTEDPMRLRTL